MAARSTQFQFPHRKINFAGGKAPTVGGLWSAIKGAASSVASAASDAVDTGSSVIRGATNVVIRPVADVASTIAHPLADLVADVPIIGSVAKMIPASMGIMNNYVKAGSAISGMTSDVSSALFGQNSTSVAGTDDVTKPFAKRIFFVNDKNADGTTRILAYIGMANKRNVFVPDSVIRPYIERVVDESGGAKNGYTLASPLKAVPNDSWKNSALIISVEDLLKSIGGSIQTDFGDGKIHQFVIYQHNKIPDTDPRKNAANPLSLVPTNSGVVLSEDQKYADPSYEEFGSTSIKNENANGVQSASSVSTNVSSTNQGEAEEKKFSTTAKIGFVGLGLVTAYVIFGRKD